MMLTSHISHTLFGLQELLTVTAHQAETLEVKLLAKNVVIINFVILDVGMRLIEDFGVAVSVFVAAIGAFSARLMS